ncbi:MAG: GmrSD restriction endonuclease domain-containing protein [Gammaproteobacteria bacterium]
MWKKSKASLLIDSLYRGFPISSLLLWQSDEETRSRRRDPRPVRASVMSWLIDGQQRVITLARTMSGDEDIEVVFNPQEDKFRLANAATRNDRNWIRIAELWDDEFCRQLRRNLDGGSAADKREARFERVRSILDYEVPLVRMVDHSFKDALLAFERINTLGVRLKKEDIESAHVVSRHTGFIVDNVAPFLARLKHRDSTGSTSCTSSARVRSLCRQTGRSKPNAVART